MAANSFGNIFKLTSFGESHGIAMGAVIDGCPAGVQWQQEVLSNNLARRRPGIYPNKKINSERNECDTPHILSGVYDNKTLGTPIAVQINNTNAQSEDYLQVKQQHRPGHADTTWSSKFSNWDHRGGGRASARETVSRVIAGSVAQMFLQQQLKDLKVFAFVDRVFTHEIPSILNTYEELKSDPNPCATVANFRTCIPHEATSQTVEELLIRAKEQGKSYGGSASLFIVNPPKSLGEPVFFKLKNLLCNAFMSVGAVCAVEMGDGIASTYLEGSDFHDNENTTPFKYGGINGGISSGSDIYFRVYFKPTSSVLDVAKQGRHDPCIIPRALPVLEAMTYLVLADLFLWMRLNNV